MSAVVLEQNLGFFLFEHQKLGSRRACRGPIYIEELQHGGENTWNGPTRTRPRGAAAAPGAQGLDRQKAA